MNNIKSNYESILGSAEKYFGNVETALNWINTPARGLAYRKPIEMIHSDEDTQAVLNLLGRLGHGVYS
ncbi:antitoxin Xre/MbcA/ParS toxin-binding domain-containing protein [Kluyvera cryocrescens]|uniref:antitoxin Xre/MbcA/ParS toxin-binding domain-containing protein n=1 Tax=Kluyvera cryocrescens TaxID=580 RepID=UPI0038993950